MLRVQGKLRPLLDVLALLAGESHARTGTFALGLHAEVGGSFERGGAALMLAAALRVVHDELRVRRCAAHGVDQ